MNNIISKYAYELIIVIGFCMILLISWLYSVLEIENENAFWTSVLPSAFVDIISVVISAILITKIIESQKSFLKKKDLFAIVNEDHKNLSRVLKNSYRIVIQVEKDTDISNIIENTNFDYEKVDEYLKHHANSEFLNHNISSTILSFEDTSDGSDKKKFSVKQIEYKRVVLLDKYTKSANEKITSYIKDYGSFFSYDYLKTLMNIKKSLNNKLFEIDDFLGDVKAVEIDVESFSIKNKNYMDKILLFENYFKDLPHDEINETKTLKGALLISLVCVFSVYLLVRIGMVLILL